MTAPATTRRAGPFAGNGVTTSFPFTFKVFATSDVQVIKTSTANVDSTLTLGSHYSITLNPDQDASPGGSITYPISGTPLATGEKLTAVGALPYDQTADLPTGGDYRAVVVENALDRTVFQVQQLAEGLGRAMSVPVSTDGVSNLLPTPEANKLLSWDAAAAALVNRSPADIATSVAFTNWRAETFSGTGAQTAFTLAADPGTIANMDVSISGVTQVNGVDFTVSGTTLTFTSAPAVGAGNILARYGQALPAVSVAGVLYVSVTAFGADPTGSADSTSAIQAAIDAVGSGTVYFPAGNYRTNATLVLSTAGCRLMGASRNGCSILANFRGGPVIRVSASRCSITDLAVSSLAGSSRRTASPFGKTAPDASVDGNSTDYGILFQEGAAVMTFTTIERVEITNQPADGIVWYGEGACTVFDAVNITYCGGHGMYFDEGGRASLSLGRPGIVDIKNCLVQLCWGHGIALATEGSNTCYRFNLINCEIYNNCYGDGGVNQPTFYSSLEAAVAARCENFRMELGAVGVSDVGLLLGTTTVAEVIGTRFVSCTTWGSYINPGCSRIRISMPFYAPDPSVGIRVRETCDNIVVDGLLEGDLTTPIDAESEVRVTINNKLAYTVPGTNTLWYAEDVKSSTIAAGSALINSRIVRLIGEGDTTDTVARLRVAVGVEIPDGYRFTICNFNAYNLTLSDISGGGTNNIQVQGSAAVLEPGESLEFVAYGAVCYAIGREIP